MADREPSSLDVGDVYEDTSGQELNERAEWGGVSEGEGVRRGEEGAGRGRRGLEKLHRRGPQGPRAGRGQRQGSLGLAPYHQPSAINVNGRTRTKAKEGHSLGPAVPCRFEGWLRVQRWQKGHRGTVSSPGGIGVRGERPASLASG